MNVKSPITNSENVEHISSYQVSITSDSRIVKLPVDNYLCLDSGVVFNATGALGGEKDFYTDEYDLHSENVVSEFKYFDSSKPVGIYDNILDFITKDNKLPKEGRYLDVGCGKGILIRKFAASFPNWKIHGIEPSKNASKFFSETLPDAEIFEGMLEDSSFVNDKFDIITANGVLEHVPYPLNFLKKLRGMLSENGLLYIGVPNFNNNPADLYTYDHLFRFTPSSVDLCFKLAGLKIVSKKVDDKRVPMWFLLKACEKSELRDCQVDINYARNSVRSRLREVKSMLGSYDSAVEKLKDSSDKLAVYGTGAFALLGLHYSKLKEDHIKVVVDDNDSIWGAKKLGVSVSSPSDIANHKDIKQVIFSANPCYISTLTSKIEKIIDSSACNCSVSEPEFS